MTQHSTPKVTIDLGEYNELLENSKAPKDVFTPEELYQVLIGLARLNVNEYTPGIIITSTYEQREEEFHKQMSKINLKVVIQAESIKEGRLSITRIK